MTEFLDPPHRVRVRYCETDRMAIAHHGSYVAWFEEARTEWMRQRGRSYRQLEDDGNLLQVVDLQCRYHKPVDYDEVVAICVRVAEARRADAPGGAADLLAQDAAQAVEDADHAVARRRHAPAAAAVEAEAHAGRARAAEDLGDPELPGGVHVLAA